MQKLLRVTSGRPSVTDFSVQLLFRHSLRDARGGAAASLPQALLSTAC